MHFNFAQAFDDFVIRSGCVNARSWSLSQRFKTLLRILGVDKWWVTFTASNTHVPEAQLFAVSYILIQLTIEPMRLTFYPAFLLNVGPTARRDRCQFNFTFVYCTFFVPNLDEIHWIDIDTNSLNRNNIRGNCLLLSLSLLLLAIFNYKD